MPPRAGAAPRQPHPPAGHLPGPGAPPLLEPQALSAIHADASDPERQNGPLPRDRRLGRDGGLHRRRPRHQQHRLHPARRQSRLRRLQGLQRRGHVGPDRGRRGVPRRQLHRRPGPQRLRHQPTTARCPSTSRATSGSKGSPPEPAWSGLDIFGAEDAGFNSSFLQAIDYAVSRRPCQRAQRVARQQSLPRRPGQPRSHQSANDAAVAAGTTVTVSSGDAGVTNTIGTPATDPNVISAGASTTYQSPPRSATAASSSPG